MSAFIFNDPFRGRQVFTNPDKELDPEVKLDYLLVEFAHSGLPQAKILRNLENFATKVMPRFAD